MPSEKVGKKKYTITKKMMAEFTRVFVNSFLFHGYTFSERR